MEMVKDGHPAPPAGAPIRISQWLIPPLALLVLAAAEIVLTATGAGGASRVLSTVAATMFSGCAVILGALGYRAYRDLTPAAVARYRQSMTVSLGVVGILRSFGLSSVGFVPLVWAGARWADDRRSRPPTAHRPGRSRMWTGIAVAAAVLTVATELLLPVAVGTGSVPLVAAALTGRIIAPFALGVSFRLRRPSTGIR